MIKKILKRFSAKPEEKGKRFTGQQIRRNAMNLGVFGFALVLSISSLRLHDWFWGVVLLLIAVLYCNRYVLGEWPDLEPAEDEDNDRTQDLRRKWKRDTD